jgi:NAD(P)-dependent dehydrogenase (short-subunit alcohol dehydrogenase family)
VQVCHAISYHLIPFISGYEEAPVLTRATSSDDEILTQFDVNVFSQIRLLRAVLPSMRSRRAGVIANLGSIAGWDGTPSAGFYCASKAAIAIYTESLRHEVAPLGIDVTCIEPGYFRTNFLTTSGGHKVTARKRINDLNAGTQQARDALAVYSLHQPGDPVKGARVIVEALTKTGRCEGRSLPGRLALGPDAMATIGESMKREQEMIDTWRDIISSTDYDDV